MPEVVVNQSDDSLSSKLPTIDLRSDTVGWYQINTPAGALVSGIITNGYTTYALHANGTVTKTRHRVPGKPYSETDGKIPAEWVRDDMLFDWATTDQDGCLTITSEDMLADCNQMSAQQRIMLQGDWDSVEAVARLSRLDKIHDGAFSKLVNRVCELQMMSRSSGSPSAASETSGSSQSCAQRDGYAPSPIGTPSIMISEHEEAESSTHGLASDHSGDAA